MRRPEDYQVFRLAVAGVCAYEAAALIVGLPTVSTLARRYPVIGTVVVAGLMKHFQPPKPTPIEEIGHG